MRLSVPDARLQESSGVCIHPPDRPVDSLVTVPLSKSYANRALILAALAQGPSTLQGCQGCVEGDDVWACLNVLHALGVTSTVQKNTVRLEGCGGMWPNAQADLFIGSAGTLARFLPGALATSSVRGGRWRMQGTRQVQRRPLAPLVEALKRLGGQIRYATGSNGWPLEVKAGGLEGGWVDVPGHISSQFISGVLLASPYARRPVTAHGLAPVVQRSYIQMTLNMMQSFGATFQVNDSFKTVVIRPQMYQGHVLNLEADVSTACYFWALAALTGGRVRVAHLQAHTCQPDIGLLDILERMGCHVLRTASYVEVQGCKNLRGGFSICMQEMADQTPTVAVLALFSDAPVRITGVGHIRYHESNRLEALGRIFSKLGVRIQAHADGMTLYPGYPRKGWVPTYQDHRLAMALALVGTKVEGICIENPGCVSKTCPTYFTQLQSLGVGVDFRT